MKILVVCSGNSGFISPFIKEQVEGVSNLGHKLEIYTIVGKGILGYLKNLTGIKKKIKEFSPDLIHAHYGLSGLVSSMQRKVPVVITYHGSDINIPYVKLFSKLAAKLSSYNIFVEEKIQNKIGISRKNLIIPCGVNIDTFFPVNKFSARDSLGLDHKQKYILFSSRFNNEVKNYPLAKKGVDSLNKQLNLIELKNKSREEVNLLFNAVDLALLTSFNEGSPQFIKEAMACNCPIVSTDVGDVKWVMDNMEGCYLTSFDVNDVAAKINTALHFSEKLGRTSGRMRIIELGLHSEIISKKIVSVYKNVLNHSLL